MNTLRLRLGIPIALAIGLFAIPAAHADTYQIFDLGSGGTGITSTFIVGITASGTAVLDYHVPAGAPLCAVSGVCNEYQTWENGVLIHYSPGIDYTTTPPNFVYDNGAPCTVSASFLTSPVTGTCNNGHEVFNAGVSVSNPMYNLATFTGPDLATDLFSYAPPFISDVDLNSSGDFVYNADHAGGGGGEYFEAIDLTSSQVPEPSSFLLVGTGLFAAAEMIRRRLKATQA